MTGAPSPVATADGPRPRARWRVNVGWLVPIRVLMGLFFPLLAALAVFGWRAAGAWMTVLLGALMGRAMLWRMKSWVATPGRMSLLVQSLLVAMFFPATLMDADQTLLDDHARWPALLSAGMLLALFNWLFRRMGTGRFHGVPCAVLVMMLGGASLVLTHRVLQREDVFTADVLDPPPHALARSTATADPWYEVPRIGGGVRVWIVAPAAERLSDFLAGTAPIGRPAQTISRLVSDDLPPLEDLVIGGHPARIGCASAVAVMIGGLFLVYRGIVTLHVPVLMLAACYLTLLVAPMPTVVGQNELARSWLVPLNPGVGWATGVTLIHYILVASPILLTTLLLAVLPGIRPFSRRAGTIYAVLYGVLCGVFTVFVSFHYGAVMALVMAQLVVPTLDRRLPDRPTL